VTLLDAYALVAFLVGGPSAPQVRGLLREGGTSVATANLAETLDVCARMYGLSVERAMEVLEPLLDGILGSVPLDLARAQRAAVIRAMHYHRASRPISLADAILIALAGPDDRIATADPDVLAVAQAEGIATIALLSQS
jgi:PIN domain nuclease of toxin-antitoxin system